MNSETAVWFDNAFSAMCLFRGSTTDLVTTGLKMQVPYEQEFEIGTA